MYPVSDDYLDAVIASSREIEYYGTITLQDSTVIVFDSSTIAQGGFTVTKDIFADEFPSIGSVCCAELDLTIRTSLDRFQFVGAEVDAYFQIKLADDSYESVPCGIFYVSEAERGINTVSLTCYDAMMNLRVGLSTNISGYPYDLISAACSACDVEFGNTEDEITAMPNGSVYLSSFLDAESTMTWDNVVGYVAEMLCGNAYIKYDGKLYIKPFSGQSSVRSFEQSDRFKLSAADYRICIGEFSFIDPSTGSEVSYDTSSTSTSTMYYYPVEFGKNPFLPTDETTQSTAITDIATAITAVYTSPFEMNIPADPSLEVGDMITLVGGQAGTSGEIGIIDNITYGAGKGMTVTGCGEYVAVLQAETSNEKAISSVNDEVDLNEIYYYEYTSTADVEIATTTQSDVILINYGSNEASHIEFHGSINCTIETSEGYDSSTETYTIIPCVVTATYYVNDVLQDYYQRWELDDGYKVLDLYYFYDSADVGSGTLSVYLEVATGTLTASAGEIIGSLMSVMFTNNLVNLYISSYPDKMVYTVGSTLDYDGLVVMGTYADRQTVNVTDLCTITPAEGTETTEEGTVTVTVSLETE